MDREEPDLVAAGLSELDLNGGNFCLIFALVLLVLHSINSIVIF